MQDNGETCKDCGLPGEPVPGQEDVYAWVPPTPPDHLLTNLSEVSARPGGNGLAPSQARVQLLPGIPPLDGQATPLTNARHAATPATPDMAFIEDMVRGAIHGDTPDATVEYLPRLGAPWIELQVMRPLRIPDDLAADAKGDFEKLPEELRKFLSDKNNAWPGGIDKDADQRALLKFFYELWVTAKRGKLPLSKMDLGKAQPAPRYRPEDHIDIEHKCGFKSKFSITAFDALWVPLIPAQNTQCCYRQFYGNLPPEPGDPGVDEGIHKESLPTARDVYVRIRAAQQCEKQRAAAVQQFEEERRQRSWDTVQLARLIRDAFAKFGLPDWSLDHMLGSDTKEFRCQSSDPKCEKKITPITWTTQIDVDNDAPFAGARKTLVGSGKDSWKRVDPKDSTKVEVKQFTWDDYCEEYNLWLVVRITLRATFWLECVESAK